MKSNNPPTDSEIEDCPHFWATDHAGETLLYCTNCRLSKTLGEIIQQEVVSARVQERTKERQELLNEYRLTAHNSGFGRQLAANLKRNADRLSELRKNT